ncbi:FG-nucleoporin nsp1 [Tulasnella sp. 418]|nr:FG-nucleoporin nsp1 [Tulasnella sp. 418]
MSNPPAFGGFGNTGKPSIFGSGTTNPAGSIFGGAGSNTNTGGNIFGGGTSANPSTATPSIFGQSTAPATGTTPGDGPKPPPFGFGANPSATTTTAASGPGTSLFGSGASPFGARPAATGTTTSTTGGLFGGTGPTATSTSSTAFGAGLFGAKPGESTTASNANTASTAPAPPSLLGGFGKPPGATPAPATGGLFGTSIAPATTTASSTSGMTTPALPSLFGGAPKDPAPAASTPAATTTTAATGTTAPSSFSLFGAKKDDTKEGDKGTALNLFANLGKPPGTTSGTATPAPIGGLFGAPSSTKPADTTKPATSTAPAAGLFGGQNSQKPADGTTTPAASGSGDKPAAPITVTVPSAAAPSTGPSAAGPSGGPSAGPSTGPTTAPVIPPSVLKGKTIEDIINGWNTDLEASAREFSRYANEVSAWDRTLIDNGNQIANLYASVLAAEKSQNDIEQSLTHIEEQQKQLSDALDGYERASNDFFEGQGIRGLDIGPADTEREKSYNLAATLNSQLDDLARSLSTMIEEVNSVTAPSGSGTSAKAVDNLAVNPSNGQDSAGADDPMSQIQTILNSHLDSLSWINDSVHEMETKMNELEVRFGSSRVEERLGHNSTRPVAGGRSRYGLGNSFY